MKKDLNEAIKIKIAIQLREIKTILTLILVFGVSAVFAFDMNVAYWKVLAIVLMFMISINLIKAIYLKFKK